MSPFCVQKTWRPPPWGRKRGRSATLAAFPEGTGSSLRTRPFLWGLDKGEAAEITTGNTSFPSDLSLARICGSGTDRKRPSKMAGRGPPSECGAQRLHQARKRAARPQREGKLRGANRWSSPEPLLEQEPQEAHHCLKCLRRLRRLKRHQGRRRSFSGFNERNLQSANKALCKWTPFFFKATFLGLPRNHERIRSSCGSGKWASVFFPHRPPRPRGRN